MKQNPRRILRDLGRRVAEVRAKAAMTQEQFAERVVGVSLKYLQRVEAGRANLTVEALVELANSIHVTVAELFEPPATREVRRGRPRKAARP